MASTPSQTTPDGAQPGPNGDVRGTTRLTELRRCIDRLWQGEPDAAPSVRSRLFEQLAHIDHEVERMLLRTSDGDPVDDHRVRACADRLAELMWWWYRPDDGRQTQLGATAAGSAA